MAKIGRNAPCPCGSGKKYKQCCGQETGVAWGPEEATAANRGMADRRVMERTMADVTRLLAEQDFASMEEANAFLQRVMAGGQAPPHAQPRSRLEEAQEIVYDAWDATGARRVQLARQALERSPDCADAYVLLAEDTAQTLDDALDLYAKGVAAGERTLGAECFREDTGHFWGIVETRPYMRARLGLAECLWAKGQRQEAIAHYRELLRLNPGDNQGVRYLLLPALLELGDQVRTKELLDQYEDDGMASWAYGRALHTFQVHGASPAAQRALAEAQATNPAVPAYLFGRQRLPAHMPAYHGFGDEAEAVVCASEQIRAWQGTPGALAWLASNEQPPPAPRRRPRAR